MRERDVEAALVVLVESLGGKCEKFTSPGRRSVPDRICSFPGGVILFVECKAPGAKPTKLQARDHAKRRALGFVVLVVDSLESVAAVEEVVHAISF